MSTILLFTLIVYSIATRCLLVLNFPFSILAIRKVLVVCKKTHQLVNSLQNMSAREADSDGSKEVCRVCELALDRGSNKTYED